MLFGYSGPVVCYCEHVKGVASNEIYWAFGKCLGQVPFIKVEVVPAGVGGQFHVDSILYSLPVVYNVKPTWKCVFFQQLDISALPHPCWSTRWGDSVYHSSCTVHQCNGPTRLNERNYLPLSLGVDRMSCLMATFHYPHLSLKIWYSTARIHLCFHLWQIHSTEVLRSNMGNFWLSMMFPMIRSKWSGENLAMLGMAWWNSSQLSRGYSMLSHID